MSQENKGIKTSYISYSVVSYKSTATSIATVRNNEHWPREKERNIESTKQTGYVLGKKMSWSW